MHRFSQGIAVAIAITGTQASGLDVSSNTVLEVIEQVKTAQLNVACDITSDDCEMVADLNHIGSLLTYGQFQDSNFKSYDLGFNDGLATEMHNNLNKLGMGALDGKNNEHWWGDDVWSFETPTGQNNNRQKHSVSISLLNRYGCWCYRDAFSYPGGRNEPVDEWDRLCKRYHHNWDCIYMDAAEQGITCIPGETKYSWTIGPGHRNGNNFVFVCADVDDWCKYNVCKIDLMFLDTYLTLARQGNRPDIAQFGHFDSWFSYGTNFDPDQHCGPHRLTTTMQPVTTTEGTTTSTSQTPATTSTTVEETTASSGTTTESTTESSTTPTTPSTTTASTTTQPSTAPPTTQTTPSTTTLSTTTTTRPSTQPTTTSTTTTTTTSTTTSTTSSTTTSTTSSTSSTSTSSTSTSTTSTTSGDSTTVPTTQPTTTTTTPTTTTQPTTTTASTTTPTTPTTASTTTSTTPTTTTSTSTSTTPTTTSTTSSTSTTSTTEAIIWGPKQCCGEYPFRMWFQEDIRTDVKRCCLHHNAIHMLQGHDGLSGIVLRLDSPYICCKEYGIEYTSNMCTFGEQLMLE